MKLATKKVFLEMFYSKHELIVSAHVNEGHIYTWIDWHDNCPYYILSPKTYHDFIKFTENLEPLLKELV